MINSKSLAQVLKELRAYAKREGDKKGKPYYKHSQYLSRLEDVVGTDGYFVSMETPFFQTLPSGQVFGTQKCTLHILDDDKKIAHSTDGIGTKEIERSSSSGAFINLNNVGIFLSQAAFVAACKSLSFFNEEFEEPHGKEESLDQLEKRFLIKGALTEGFVDKAYNKRAYYADAYEILPDGRTSSVKASIGFYPNIYTKCEDIFLRFMTELKNSHASHVHAFVVQNAKKSSIENPCYVFKSFL